VAACQNAAVGFDLIIRGATVVTPGHREAADIGIADGRIAQLGGAMTGERELDAGGLLAIPGGIDAHTHLAHRGLADRLDFPIWVDDFWSGSRAAIAGGITTIGNMTYPVPAGEDAEETPSAAISREMAGAASEAAVDWFLHPILLHPAELPAGAVAALAEAGHASIKMFLSDPDLAAARAVRLRGAVGGTGRRRRRHGVQRPRAVDAGGQARPRAQRGDRAARSRRPRDADAHAVRRRRGQSLAGYSVYDGWQVQGGWPRFVVRRGQLVLADGQITARPGDGGWLRRPVARRSLYRVTSPR
jgi:dihydroorotase-like cyclic amidohydrolase